MTTSHDYDDQNQTSTATKSPSCVSSCPCTTLIPIYLTILLTERQDSTFREQQRTWNQRSVWQDKHNYLSSDDNKQTTGLTPHSSSAQCGSLTRPLVWKTRGQTVKQLHWQLINQRLTAIQLSPGSRSGSREVNRERGLCLTLEGKVLTVRLHPAAYALIQRLTGGEGKVRQSRRGSLGFRRGEKKRTFIALHQKEDKVGDLGVMSAEKRKLRSPCCL